MNQLSRYTVEVRQLIESGVDLGMKDFEIFDENYRTKLTEKIIKHYYFHEIGFETVARFKHYLNTTLNEIMPRYNKMYIADLLEINPFLSFERKKTENREIESNQSILSDSLMNSIVTGETENLTFNKDIFSDTPKSILSVSDIESNLFASEVRVNDNKDNHVTSNKNDTSSTNNSTSNNKSDEINVVIENGFEVPLSDLVVKYRESLINIDMKIINDLKDLFMMVY